MAGATLTIVGAIDEMMCGGRGCEKCPYACGDELEYACAQPVPTEPWSLARRLAAAVDAPVPEPETLGYATDAGRVYEVHELEAAARGLSRVAAAVRAQLDPRGRDPAGVTRFNEVVALERAGRVFERAREFKKRVVLEV